MWSKEQAHEALVDVDTFDQVQRIIRAGRRAPRQRRARPATRAYVLRGLIRCGYCGKTMEAATAHDQARYRCRAARSPLAPDSHPATVYVREDAVLPALDRWLAQVFDPENLAATVEAMAAAQGPDDASIARAAAASRTVADCDLKIGRLLKSIEDGLPVPLVTARVAQLQRERAAAEIELGEAVPRPELSPAQIRDLVANVRDTVRLLAGAEAGVKAAIYTDLGVTMRYEHNRGVVVVEAKIPDANRPAPGAGRVAKSVSEGGLEPPRPCGH